MNNMHNSKIQALIKEIISIQSPRKTLIVNIEGLDGSGKETVSRELKEELERRGMNVKTISFPTYREGSAVTDYLQGKLKLENPSDKAMLYVLDRQESLPDIEAAIYENDVIIMDRYVTSNLYYMTKGMCDEEAESFICKQMKLEYVVNKLPYPDFVIFINTAIDGKPVNLRQYLKFETEDAMDIHERDTELLNESYKAMMSLAPKINANIIDTFTEDKLNSVEQSVDKILDLIRE